MRDLPDALLALYLAILVLVGTRYALAFAIVTPLVTFAVRLRSSSARHGAVDALVSALWRGATSSLTLLAAGAAYSGVAALLQPQVRTTLRAHVLAALAASLVTLDRADLYSFDAGTLSFPSCARCWSDYLREPNTALPGDVALLYPAPSSDAGAGPRWRSSFPGRCCSLRWERCIIWR